MKYINALIILCGIAIILFMIKKLKTRYMFLYIFSGIAALLSCDILMSFYGENMPLNTFSLIFSGITGIPGVIMLTVFKTFLL